MAVDKNTVSKEAQKYASKGQFDKAVAEWKKLLKETRDTRDLASIYNTIGDLYLKKDAKTDAADAFKRSADILAEDGLESKAIAVYKKVLNLDPKRIEVHLAIGDLNAAKGLTGGALESYKIVADHYQKNKEMAKVLGIYQKMADLNSANVAFRIKLADMYAKEGMKQDAAKAYLAAATVHVGGNKFNEARQLFEKVLTLDPENKEVYHKAGIVYFKEGKFAEACKALKRIFEADPANEEVADLYLEALTSAGREQDALEVYQKILAADPSKLDIRDKLFRLALGQKRFDAAIAEAAALADAKREQMELDGGIEVFTVLIEAAPELPEARLAFAQFCSRAGRAEEGAREFVRYAQLIAASGDRDEARKALKQAQKLWPGHEEAQRVLDQLEAAPVPSPSPPQEEAEAAPAVEPPAPGAPLEDQAIIEGLTESEVLLKYGLAAKAIEQLEGLAARHPGSLRLHLRLRELHREQGAGVQAAEHAVRAADISASRGEQGRAEALLREAVEIDPRNAEANARLGLEPPPPEEPAGEMPSVEDAAPSPDVQEVPSAPGGDLPFASPDQLDEEPASVTEEALEELSGDAFEELPEEAPDEADAGREAAAAVEEAAEPAEPAAFEQEQDKPSRELAAESFEGEVDVNEVWAEAEFYYQQGLYDDARKKYEKILEQRPDDPRTLKRIKEIGRQKDEVEEFSSLAEAVEGLESLVSEGSSSAPELATATSDEEAVRSLMQDIKSAQREEEARRQEKELERREREQREQEERERAEREQRAEAERKYRELKAQHARAEHESQLRAEQEARVKAERELLELKAQREREEQEARIRAEQEAREKAERELQQLRAQWDHEKRDRERLAQEAREQAEREAREKAERELRELQAQRERETAAARAQKAEEDFGDLGEELRYTIGKGPVSAPAPRKQKEDNDFSELDAAFAQFGVEAEQPQPAATSAANDDDFFDLASELKEELGAVPIPDRIPADAEDQSLEDIFEDFKKGVEQQEVGQDANSHYNLGIAYKEMGLLDDAVAEFLLTSEGEPKFVESRYLLGLCFLEQGDYHKAIAEIHNALNYAMSFPVSEEERISMLYDLGLAYQGAGNTDEAINQFEMVLNADSQYRDVAVKLHELRAGEFVSLDQLKEDIEKEISSKFLEEGERVEREEKTRKNDAVRN